MKSFSRYISFLILIFSTASAQYYFGRNKIQHHPFDWHVLTAPHFEIYYYKEEGELAASGAFFAEESFRDLEKKFNFTIIERIPLIFYSSHLHFQQTNTLPYMIPEGVGGFFEFVKGRVVIPYDGSTFQFERVIRHELVHVFMHNKIDQILKLHNILSYRSPPLWFTEGLAEFWSSEWDSKAEMVIRDALLNDYLVPLEKLDLRTSGFLLYKEGQSFLRFIDSEYGSDKLLLIMESIWKDNDFQKIIEEVLGLDFREISDEWRYFYKKDIYPLLATKKTAKVSSTPVTKRGINSAPAYYAAKEGDKVIFLTNRTGYSDIYIQDLAPESRSVTPELLVSGERQAQLESLHFLQTRIDVNSSGHLAFPSKSGATDVLNFLDVEEGRIFSAFSDSNVVSISSPAWSHAGHQVAFSGIDWQGFQDLYVLQVEDMKLSRLTNDFYADRDPTFSPDDDIIVFSSDRGPFGNEGFFNLFLYDLDTGSIRALTEGRFNDISPDWSQQNPDRLAFTSDRDGTHNIWLREEMTSLSGSSDPIQLTDLATGAFDPKWSGDDESDLLYTAFENYRFHVHLLKNVDDQIRQAVETLALRSGKQSHEWNRSALALTSDRKGVPYQKKYSFDIAQTAVAYDPIFGFLGGAQITISDLLGNDYYHLLLFNTAERSSEILGRINFAVQKVDLSRRINMAYGLFHFANDYFSYTDGFFFERRLGGQFALSYPFSVFRRIEVTSSAWKAERQTFGLAERFNAFLVSNSFSYVFDNSIWGPVGPVDGVSIRLTLGRTIDFSRSNIYYTGFLSDVRKYFRISLRTLYALRLMAWLNRGRDEYRFYIGGSWGLRGFKRTEIAGRNFLLINNEFRFPFARELVLRFSSFDIGLSPIQGALFFDVGNAWNRRPTGLLGSFGLGLRGNFLGVIVLRLDIGKTTNFRTVSEGLFAQFFFGWNY